MQTPQLVLRSSLVALGSFAFAVGASAAPEVIYRETFATTVNFETPSGWGGGWSYHRSNNTGGNVADAAGNSMFSNTTGRPSDATPVNAGTYAQNAQGIVALFNNEAQRALFFTSEYTWDSATLSSISWYNGHGNAGVQTRAALMIGGQWYVSETAFSGQTISGGSAFGAEATQVTLNSGAQWVTLDYTLGATPFTLGVAASGLPSGTVQAMGIYADTQGLGNARFDTFQVTAVPEPSAMALLMGAAGLGFATLRRRARSA